jgi:integrase
MAYDFIQVHTKWPYSGYITNKNPSISANCVRAKRHTNLEANMTSTIVLPKPIQEIDIPRLVRPKDPIKFSVHKLKNASNVYLRHFHTGSKTFVARIKDEQGKRKLITLGHPPVMTIKQAREEYEQYKTLGVNAKMRADKHKRLAITTRDDHTTVEYLLSLYLAEHLPKLKAPGNVESIMKLYVVPILAGLDLSALHHSHIKEKINALRSDKSEETGRKTFIYCNDFLAWCVEEDYLETNPAANISRKRMAFTRKQRKRALSFEEAGMLLRVLDAHRGMRVQTRIGLELLLLTAVRSGELLQAEWKHINFKAATWRIPEENTKTSEQFEVMLAPRSVALLQRLKEISRSDKVLGGLSVATMNRAFKRLQQPNSQGVVLLHYDYAYDEGETKKHVTCHDLRRSARTFLSTLGVQKDTAERYLNHGKDTIEETYNRAQLEAQRLEAANLLADKLESLRG